MRRSACHVAFTAVLLVCMVGIAFNGISMSQTEPVVSVNPQQSTASVGEVFTVDINIADVTLENTEGYGITAWEVYINFSSTVLNAVSIMEGPWLKTAGDTMEMSRKIDNSAGTAIASFMLFPPKTAGALGSGTLCNITFRAMNNGRSDLHFHKAGLRAYNGSTYLIVSNTAVDGFFTNVHDVSIVSVLPSPSEVQPGASVSVEVTAANEGDLSETFSVTVYINIGALRLTPEVDTKAVTNLASGSTQPLSFSWDTTDAYAGNYTLSAEASVVAGEVDVADNEFSDGKVKVSILGAPKPSFIYSPVLPSVDETVEFNSTSVDTDGTIVSWEWDFNCDGVVDATVPNATYAYDAAGTYTPILYVTDNEGKKAFTYETVKATTFPVASFTYSPLEVLVRQAVSFSSASYDSDGHIVSWEWDFDGDGTVDSNDENPTYTYNDAGTFKVNLTVIDDDGLIDSATQDLVASRKHDVAVSTVSEEYGVDYGIWALEETQALAQLVTSTYAGFQRLNVTASVENIGTEIETFYVKAYYNDTLIGSTQVIDLAPKDKAPSNTIRVGVFPWDTLTIPGGNYTIKFVADLESDQDTNNDAKTWGWLSVYRVDVALEKVEVSTEKVLAGSLLNVTVVVKNEGTGPIDSCRLHIRFENSTDSLTLLEQSIEVKQVAAGTEKSGSVNLNITKAKISPGIYALSVEASKLIAEYFLENNIYEYGNITIGASLISIHTDILKASVGSTVNINGTVAPNRSNLDVIIRYRESGDSMWRILKRVTTDAKGIFSCSWSPHKTGAFELQAIWDGNNAALGSQSEILNIDVEPARTNVFLYAAIGAIIAFELIVIIYFVKLRKPRKP